MRSDEIKIFAGNSNKALAEAVSRSVEQPGGADQEKRQVLEEGIGSDQSSPTRAVMIAGM